MIVKTEHTLGGQARIDGTRISVRCIWSFHEVGYTPEKILEQYPHLELDQIKEAIAYGVDHPEDLVDDSIDESSEQDLADVLLGRRIRRMLSREDAEVEILVRRLAGGGVWAALTVGMPFLFSPPGLRPRPDANASRSNVDEAIEQLDIDERSVVTKTLLGGA